MAIFVPWGGGRTLWFPDEPDVAEPAMAMIDSGDWLVPRRNGVPWLDYPPLTYWLGAASSRLLGGPSPFALRLPVAVIAVLLVALTGFVVDGLAGRRAALFAGLSLATAPHFAYQAVNFHPDMAFAFFVSAGIAAYAWGVQCLTGWRGGAVQAAGFVCFGLAILAKGILGLLLPGLILFAWHLSLRRWGAILWMGPLSLVALSIAAPWYLLLSAETSVEFVWREVYAQNFARFAAAERGHLQPWHYYLVRIWFDWAPWSLLLPGAVLTAWRRDWKAPLRRLGLLCVLVGLVFFTLAATKREVYLLPVYPAVAYLIGRQAALHAELPAGAWSRWMLRGLGAAALLTGVAAVAAGLSGLPSGPAAALPVANDLALPLLLLGGVLGLGGAWLLWLAKDGVTSAVLMGGGALLGFVYLIFLISLLPQLDGVRSYRPAALWLREQSGSRPIGFYLPGAETKHAGIRVNDPTFLPLELLATPADAALYLESSGNLVLLRADQAENLAPLVPAWDQLPKRTLSLSGKPFLVLGPDQPVDTR